MKTYEQIKKAFEDALETDEGKITAEAVTKACATVQEKATEKFGAGVYVNGKLNADAQGVSFTYKRPSIRQRLQFFIPAHVDKPPRNPEAGKESQRQARKSKRIVDAQHDDSDDAGASQDERTRLQILLDASELLNDDEFTNDGRPHVDALNEALDEGVDPFNAAERDQLWAERS